MTRFQRTLFLLVLVVVTGTWFAILVPALNALEHWWLG